jgi:hypothetical protein
MAKTYTQAQLENDKLYRAICSVTGAKIVGIKETIICRQGVSCFFKGVPETPVMMEYNDSADLTDSEAVTENGACVFLTEDWNEIPESRVAFIEITEEGDDVP